MVDARFEAAPGLEVDACFGAVVAHRQPQVAQRRGGEHPCWVVAPRFGRPGAYGGRAEAGEPAVIWAGAGRGRRAHPVDEPRSVQASEAVLHRALGQPGESEQLPAGEDLVRGEEAQQALIGGPWQAWP